MYRQHFDAPYQNDQPPFGRGHHGQWGESEQGPWGGRGRGPWGGHGRDSWGGRGSGRAQIAPYLAAAFLARLALRYAFDGPGARGPRGPWDAPHRGHGGWDDQYRPDARGGRGYGPPWRRGGRGWRGDGHDRGPDQGRATVGALRSEVGALIGLLRGAWRQGAPDARQLDEIRAVLADARTRIAAIMAETQPTRTNV